MALKNNNEEVKAPKRRTTKEHPEGIPVQRISSEGTHPNGRRTGSEHERAFKSDRLGKVEGNLFKIEASQIQGIYEQLLSLKLELQSEVRRTEKLLEQLSKILNQQGIDDESE